jgi:uncharacterized membrane protein
MATLSVLTFPDITNAEQMIAKLKEFKQQHLVEIDDAALISRDASGKPKIKHLSQEMATGKGALGGAFWGLLFGLIFFVPVVGTAVGAAAGAIVGHMADLGIDKDFIKKIGENIQPGQAALCLLTEKVVVDKVKGALQQYNAKLLETSLSKEEEKKLRETLGVL